MLSGFGHIEIIALCYWQTLFWDLQKRSIQLCPPPHLSRLCYRTSQFWTSQFGLHLNPCWHISSYIILCDDQHHWQVNSQQLQEFGGYPTDHKTTRKTFYETKAVQNRLDDTFWLKILTNIAPIQRPTQSMDSVSIPTGEITANHGFHFLHCKHWVWDQVMVALLLQLLSFMTRGTTDRLIDWVIAFTASGLQSLVFTFLQRNRGFYAEL